MLLKDRCYQSHSLHTFESKALAREISMKPALPFPLAAEDWYMKKIGISHLRDQKINAISGGERQRVFLAKLLAQETRILLLDEPIFSLDIKYQEGTFGLLRS